MTNQIAVIESNKGLAINREQVVEFGDTLMGIHPSAKEIGLQGMRTIAQLALVTGANPLPGTNGIHAWKDKKGRLCFKFGIGYWRTQAELEGGILWVDRPRPMTESEREYYGITKEQIASICTGALKKNAFGLMQEARDFGFEISLKDAKQEVGRTGVGIVNPNEYAKQGRPAQWSADKRAETDLLGQLVPAMSPALQNAQSGANVEGGLDWSAGEYAHLQTGETLSDDYGMADANGDLFEDEPGEVVDVETGEVTETSERTFSDIVAGNGDDETEAESNGNEPEDEPLPDDEQVIADGQAIDFWINVVALIDRYTVAQHAQAAAKKLGYEVVPGNAAMRLLMYRDLKEQATKRDIEDAVKEAVATDEAE